MYRLGTGLRFLEQQQQTEGATYIFMHSLWACQTRVARFPRRFDDPLNGESWSKVWTDLLYELWRRPESR